MDGDAQEVEGRGMEFEESFEMAWGDISWDMS